jgi:hypothetical protein
MMQRCKKQCHRDIPISKQYKFASDVSSPSPVLKVSPLLAVRQTKRWKGKSGTEHKIHNVSGRPFEILRPQGKILFTLAA